MTKKNYMKPEIEVVKLQQKTLILTESQEDINENLQDEEVTSGW